MRVLVVPTSKHGGTAEIGRAMATALRERGVDVDVSQPEHLHDLDRYAGFIVGSGLYMSRWIDRASDFVEEHAAILRSRPTWLFSSGPLGTAKPEEPFSPELIEHLVKVSGAREHRLFSGRLQLDRLGRTERFIAKWVGAKDGDYREWDEIAQWTAEIADALAPTDQHAAPADH